MFPDGFISSDRIHCNSTASSKKKLLEEAGELLCNAAHCDQSSVIFDKLLERERLGSTGFGHGVALPHARLTGITQAYGCFLRVPDGVDFDAIDNKPVDLVFALLVPEEATDEHLKLLSLLASIFSSEESRERLRKIPCNDNSSILNKLINFSDLAQTA